ncbi:heme NO-binding domain-containing protein [Brunnivagina elsteri]|uniref:Heme NO-binding protein n=1 Tax=Brunnivagina elsteri CCALA 953 TaxID=987040 RepID=A0A2A2TJ94_9CYAN|nr:heme NO-binding domain-containing protein [Calothrix elsteri]PAX54846.1 heme NO-binding protein [Calothrix elsteri CCALA 953]
MYGLVNKAIEQMVCDRFGEETWQKIKSKAEIEVNAFTSMEAYPDDVTHRLVKAASHVLDLPSADIMRAFGEFWVKFTSEGGYGELMEMSGDTLPEFLQNLDQLHARVGVSFPQLQPPSFESEQIDEETLTLDYHSHREGLAPMVVGLIEGLGERFNTSVEVTQRASKDEGSDCDRFEVRYKRN